MNQSLDQLALLSTADILQAVESSESGLSTQAAALRQKQFGKNQVRGKSKPSTFVQAIFHAINPLVGILLLAAIVASFTGSAIDATIILSILVLSFLLDYVQTHRALIAVQELQNTIASKTTVLRDGSWAEILSVELVPGDLIRLSAGTIIPADCLLIMSKDLHVQQAALTGESLPIEKEWRRMNTHPSTITESINVVLAGSSVISGFATAVVVNTGNQTLYGEIAQTLSKVSPKTEFEKGMTRFGIFISKLIFIMVIFVLVMNLYFHRPLLDSLLFSIALAVGLTPELLPMITTVTLSSGAVQLARKKVIVKNLAAIQNIGSIDILCSDKTGTLTTGVLTLEKSIGIHGDHSSSVRKLGYLMSLFGTEITNPFNTAVLKQNSVNPLEPTLLEQPPDITAYQKIDELPFDFERRRSSIVVVKDQLSLLITKGAPEFILPICRYYDDAGVNKPFDSSSEQQAFDLFASLSQEGYRVLALASRHVEKAEHYSTAEEHEMIFMGFLVFYDPPLEEVHAVIQNLKHEGVAVKIITGDNEQVTHHVCNAVGLDTQSSLTGEQLNHIDDQALPSIAESTTIFARVSPMQKLRIINALRARGHVVGYLGDGINDAPSLHQADIGISVAGAADIAREAADIVLLERHLKVLLNGILLGRQSFGNVMKYLLMGTSSNFGNMISMALAVLFLPFLPMLPTQILLNNLLYDLSQITIPTDHVDSSLLRKPRHWEIDSIRQFMLYIGPISSIFDFLTFYVMLHFFNASESLFQTGWFVESLATQTLVIFVIRTAKKPWQSQPSLPLTLTVLGIVALGIAIPYSPIGPDWGFSPLPLSYFVFLVVATVIYLSLVERLKNRLLENQNLKSAKSG